MRYPLKMTANLAKYITTQRLKGTDKFPMVMMLEPLHACNLTCTGCGRIREYKSTINEIMTVEKSSGQMSRPKPPTNASMRWNSIGNVCPFRLSLETLGRETANGQIEMDLKS